MQTFSGAPAVQIESELEGLLGVVRERAPRSYIEVGVGRGDTFHAIVSAMPPGSRAVAVDDPEQAWGLEGSRAQLVRAAADLTRKGYDVHLIFGNSRATRVIDEAAALGPFDMAFLDGDHTLKGVTSDWIHYGSGVPVVAFHDIVDTMRPNLLGEVIEVPKFWEVLKSGVAHVEFVAPGSTMGIGVAYQC